MNAARALFFEKGYRGTTIEQIARKAGYSKRTVYLDFSNKDELFIQVGAEGLELLLTQLAKIPYLEYSAKECIESFIKIYIRFSRQHSELFQMIFRETTKEIIDNCPEDLRKRVASLEHACLGAIVAWANKAMDDGSMRKVDPWEVAGMAVGSATGIILLSMGGSQTIFSKKTLESLVKKAVWNIWLGLSLNTEKLETVR